MDPNVDVAKMEKLLDMQERIFDKQAEMAFNSAMVECQAEMGAIRKESWNDQTKSFYAKLEVVTADIKPVYTSHGFCLSFSEAECPTIDWIRTQCEVSHVGGFSKTYYKDLPLDDAGIKGTVNKTPVHAVASTGSYGKRYVTVDIFNIVIAGTDNDAQSAKETFFVTLDQIETLRKELKINKKTEEWFLTRAQVVSIDLLARQRYEGAIKLIKERQ